MTNETQAKPGNGLVKDGGALVTDAEIDALVEHGWDWHSAYRHLQTAAHSKNAAIAKAKGAS